jgi:outer membrane receptor protein involved in Fe transport
MKSRRLILSLAVTAFAAAAASLATASAPTNHTTPIEEIIVRAELRDTGLMNLAASVSVQRPDDRRDVVDHLEEMLGRIANVNYASGSSRARYLQIRGIGETGQFAEPLNASVGVIVDGADLSGIGSAATTFDIEQVEVFRGPQGTLYGANALAGLINVVSAAPTEEWYGRVNLDAGNEGAWGVGGVLSGPIADGAGLRLAVNRHADDGYMHNDFLRRDDTNRREETTARGRFRFTGEDTSLDLIGTFVDVDNRYDAFSLDNDRHTLSDQPGEDTQESVAGSVRVRHTFDEGLNVEAVIAHVASDIGYGYDEDWAFDGFHPDGYSSTDHYARDWETTSVDLRLLSAADESLVDWVFGLYGLSQEVDLTRTYTFLPGPYTSRHSVDRYAAYGEVSIDFSERVRLVTGLRGESHNSEFSDSEGVGFTPGDVMLGGRLVLEYRTRNALFYAGINRGYKAGGFNTSGTLDADLRTFQPEVLWSLEAGIKGDLLDDRLRLRLAVFRMSRDDVQVNTSIVRVRPDGSAEFIDFTGNAAEGFNQGLEVEFEWAVHPLVTLDGSLGLLDTEYDDFVNGAGDTLDGRRQSHAPGWQFHTGIEFRPADGWFFRFDAEGKDEFYFSDSHDTRSDEYVLLHASAGYETEGWRVSVWSRNLTDEDVLTRGFFFGNDPRDGYTAKGYTQLGEPRRFGVSATMSF